MADRLLLASLRGYQAAWLGADVVAGLTLVAIALPEQMATARLANMPSVVGLYAFVAGSVVYALLGSNGKVSVGADSTIAPILGAAVSAIAVAGSVRYDHLISLLALMVGGVVALTGLFRFGWIAEFLSAPVVTGVLAGIAVEIVVKQLPALLGVADRGGTTLNRLRGMAGELGHINGWSLGIGLGVLTVVLVGEKLDRRAPGALVAAVASILVVGGGDLATHGVTVVGVVKGGLPPVRWPGGSWSDAAHLVTPALTAGFLCLAQTAATVRTASAGAPASGGFNRDLLAVGAGSLASGLGGSFAVNSSPPRTQVLANSGARSQVAGLFAAGLVLALAALGPGLLHDLPQATLAGILLYVATRLFRGRELLAILRFDRIEFALAVLTLLGVVFIGIEQGVAMAIVLSLGERTRRAARPRDAILGREPGTDHWVPTDIGQSTEQVPGVLVYMIYAPLWYANADYVRLRISQVVQEAGGNVRALVLDADGMSDIDYTGAAALGQLASELKARGVTTAIARASHLVHHDLKHSGLLADIGPDHLYSSVEEAVASLRPPGAS